jgi:hypothetical protein
VGLVEGAYAACVPVKIAGVEHWAVVASELSVGVSGCATLRGSFGSTAAAIAAVLAYSTTLVWIEVLGGVGRLASLLRSKAPK